MKLRLQSNSIRFRLKRAEVRQLAEIGRVEEMVVIGGPWGGTFSYSLEAADVSGLETDLLKSGILVRIPRNQVTAWAGSDEIGIEAKVPAREGLDLHLLIEKDFACLNGPPEQNVDTFPNPLEGTKC